MATLFLATVMGWYFIIFSLLLLCRYDHMQAVLTDIMSERAIFFILSLISLIIGLLLVVSHNVWIKGWPLCVTIVSWWVLISALLRLFIPNTQKRAQRFIQNPLRVKTLAIIFLIIGLYLLFNVYYIPIP